MAVGNLVKRLQDIMRKDAGINGDAQRIEQMVWMFFLKVYDAAEEDWELEEDNFKSIIPEPLRWRNWAPSKDEEGKEKNDTLTGQLLLDFINDKLFRVLKGMDYGVKSIKDENGKTINNPDFIEGIKVTRDTPRHKAVVYDIFGEFIKEVLPMEQIQVTNRQGQPDVLKLQTYVLSDGINTIAGEAVGNFAEAATQLKLKVGGWVQVSLEFSVNDRKTQDGRDFKAQRVRIINISPLWGHDEPAEKAF